ncbi:TAXI family TRAP transporter solute-binding subunit, partial [Frankia tisae]|uniref:TAXI family TRAP transporter solute-binding subunit n=1 Tax=Frankia tisae TaxID=2950104 RepID=UPI0021BF6E3F
YKRQAPPWWRRRAALIATAAVVVAALVAGAVYILQPPARLGACRTVSVYTGQENTPYYNYGLALKRRIHASNPDTDVTVEATNGTADNLARLQDPGGSTCAIAISQLNGAVDAHFGVNQFRNDPIDGLRTVGPVWLDILHLIVRADSGIDDATQLCNRRISTGLNNSGSLQVGQVLFNNVLNCQPATDPADLDRGLADLRDGKVDGVLWAGGAPTPQILRAVAEDGLRIRLLPLARYLAPMGANWDAAYRQRLGNRFVSGSVYEPATIDAQDYPGIGQTETVGVPNGLVVNQSADHDLVAFIVQDLFKHRPDFEQALWGTNQNGRHFETAAQTVPKSSLYCLVPLAPEAKRYYDSINIHANCG